MTLTADNPKFRKLTRAQLQSLAKREGVRAVGKTEDIIRRLVRKQPNTVPTSENTDKPSAPSTPPKRELRHEMAPTMDSPELRKLTRAQVQSIAKREGLRAVGKTVDIIRRLIQKHPRGVPVLRDNYNPSASLGPSKQDLSKKSHIDSIDSPLPSPTTKPSEDRTGPKDKGKQVARTTSPSPSSSSEALRQLLYPEDEHVAEPSNTNATPYPEIVELEVLPDHISLPGPSQHPPRQVHNKGENTHNDAASPEVPGWRADEDEADETYDNADHLKGAPNHYMVVDALRQFTNLANTIPSMETRIAESRRLLQHAETLLDKAVPDARELVVTREYLETFLLGKMKQKRELWDGTAQMEKQDRKLRMELLRAERRAENEKRWRETNELYKKNGLKPEPFSAFASESDEEIIESLQTTPASSRDASAKRAREESDDGESHGDSDTEGQSQRKRARS